MCTLTEDNVTITRTLTVTAEGEGMDWDEARYKIGFKCIGDLYFFLN